MLTRQEWQEQADRGTSGDMVGDILQDWEASETILIQQGRREVVEWVRENSASFELMEDFCFGQVEWKAKLKEWGIIPVS